ncbi:hypothetical protein CR513_50496, partial [Mucuna pruriens]
MAPFLRYLRDEHLPDDLHDAKRIAREVSRYALVDQHLYRRGMCGTHIGSRTLVSKIARAGYYWPTLKADCAEYVRKCDKCQRYAEIHKAPLERLHSVTSTWLFHKWGAKATNKVILRELRKRLKETKGRWAEELPQVLWSDPNSPNSILAARASTKEYLTYLCRALKVPSTPSCLTFEALEEICFLISNRLTTQSLVSLKPIRGTYRRIQDNHRWGSRSSLCGHPGVSPVQHRQGNYRCSQLT